MRMGEGLESSCPFFPPLSPGLLRGAWVVYLGAPGHEHMTEWARSREALRRPEGAGDRHVRSGRWGHKGHSFTRSGPGDFSVSCQRMRQARHRGSGWQEGKREGKSRVPRGRESPDLRPQVAGAGSR